MYVPQLVTLGFFACIVNIRSCTQIIYRRYKEKKSLPKRCAYLLWLFTPLFLNETEQGKGEKHIFFTTSTPKTIYNVDLV